MKIGLHLRDSECVRKKSTKGYRNGVKKSRQKSKKVRSLNLFVIFQKAPK